MSQLSIGNNRTLSWTWLSSMWPLSQAWVHMPTKSQRANGSTCRTLSSVKVSGLMPRIFAIAVFSVRLVDVSDYGWVVKVHAFVADYGHVVWHSFERFCESSDVPECGVAVDVENNP